ncbi:aspartate/aromatic aminotransferase [Erysipelotrichaceae bacterium MTC7]|nr:aspartate/aromatic aminotransferase [Erysipelotrichaceae bacterium MTC7]
MKTFVKEHVNNTPIVDNVFSIVSKAKEAIAKVGPENVVDATIGALYGEDGQLVAFESVYRPYDAIADRKKAAYAQSFVGNEDYRKAVYDWVVQDTNLELAHSVIATPGGSGAVSTTISMLLDQGETLIIPEIAWGSYKLMATMNNIETVCYSLFDGDGFNLANFKETCKNVMKMQGKVLVIINDPCHNPTGYSLTNEEWDAVMEIANELSQEGPFMILNDIAYIDFAYDFKASRNYMHAFNQMADNVMVVVAFSCSKTLTAYGLRCGAAMILAKHQEQVRQVEIVMEKAARAIWSNIPNAAMQNFVYVTGDGRLDYDLEKDSYVSILKERSDIFIEEADACGLAYYPYREGFFVTLRYEDPALQTKMHEACMDANIFTVKVNKGIRVALCSISVEKVKGLAHKMKEINDTL